MFVSKIDLSRYVNKGWLTLIHHTDLQSAEAIISTQKFIPSSSGWFGPGIYFANTIEAATKKSNRHGVYLIADVYLGKVYPVHVNDYKTVEHSFALNGYTGVIGYGIESGREIVVFYPHQVKNIKFCCGLFRLKAVFRTHDKVLTLFYITSSQNAAQIVQSQKIPKTKGPFGYGCYLYDSIADAILVNPNAQTYLAAYVNLNNFCRLKKVVDIKHLTKKYKTFKGVINSIQYFIIEDSNLITDIHFCGGMNWNLNHCTIF